MGENRLTVAMVDFYLAQTLEDGAAAHRRADKSVKEFDAIYQDFREAFLGWRAHFWHGRILQELGKTQRRQGHLRRSGGLRRPQHRGSGRRAQPADKSQKGRSKTTGLGRFLRRRRAVLSANAIPTVQGQDYLEEVKTWRAAHKANSERCYGYQALTFELAKNYLAIGEKSKNEATKEVAKTRGPAGCWAKWPRSPALTSRTPSSSAANSTPTLGGRGFRGRRDRRRRGLEKKKWAEATEFYEKAIAAAGPKTDQQRLADVKNTLVGCYHNQAMQLYQKGKVDEAIAMAKKALKPEFLQTKTAPGVAVFLLNVQYYQYLGAAEGTDAEKKAKSRAARQGLRHRQVDPQVLGRQGRGRRRADRAAAPGPGPGEHGRGRQDPEAKSTPTRKSIPRP